MAEAKPKKPMKRRPIAAAATMKKIMADYFYSLDAAAKDPNRKVAWCTSVGPAELLHVFGFAVHYPENHGALLGATRTATDFIPTANALGYSPDICSYLTSDVGSFLKGETPLSKAYPGIESLPRPDVLVYNTNQCRDVQDWLMWYARHFGVPCVGVHTHRGLPEVTETHIEDVAGQIRGLIPTLEEVSGRKFDMDRFREVVGLSRRCSELWRRTLETAAAVPSPLTFFDGCIHMGPAVVLRGTQTAVDYYEELLPELEKRIQDGVGALEEERFRVYWEGMPIWGKLRELSGLFWDLKTCVVASTYCNSWIFEQFDPERPFESMARAYTELFIVRDDGWKEGYIERMVRQFKVNGIIFHDAKTCPNNTNSRYGMPQRLQERLGIPCVTVHGDLNDLRLYSEEQTRTQIEALVEQMSAA